ncbi:hypothetical protein P9299_29885 [Bacillus cereus]|uniref:hypothetical protein n=1 Tax=Bacillus thuringiensis TaxID=1428 RepID=UPI0015CF3208|nr:hypothetical protein [Bacillus thuringiensis]MED4447212.1 hypothetical protein [Bacillus cereus]
MKKFVIRNRIAFGEIRLVDGDGKYHTVLSDIAQELQIKGRGSSKLSKVCRNLIKCPVPTNGGIQMMKVFPIKEVQRILIKSKMPTAEHLQKKANKTFTFFNYVNRTLSCTHFKLSFLFLLIGNTLFKNLLIIYKNIIRIIFKLH